MVTLMTFGVEHIYTIKRRRTMTLDEAIKHAEEKAKELREQAEQLRDIGERISNPKQPYNEPVKACLDCAEEHEQLAEWLKELKRYKEAE